ncbi:hypothetical protein C8Q80DRAFT_1061794, partial [Daedaleopsis nitida]
MDEVIAFMYMGPNVLTEKEYKHTPLLVRHHKVMAALEWLKLNHVDYADLDISKDNLLQYSEHEPPMVVNYTNTYGSNQDPEATAVNNIEEEDSTDEGDCPFIVHGLTGSTLAHLGKVRPYEITARAIKYFKTGGKVLSIGQRKEPESVYNNLQLYPQMF